MTPFDLIELSKRAGSAQELIALAREQRIELSEEDAQIYFDRWHGMGELSDDDLDLVSGGVDQSGSLVCALCGRSDGLGIDVSGCGYYCYHCRCRCQVKYK